MNTASQKRTVIIASLHFAPAFASHMIAYAKALCEASCRIVFVLDRKYLGFASFESMGTVVPAAEAERWLKVNHADVAIFANAAITNFVLATRMRMRGLAVYYVFHEPGPLRIHLTEGIKDLSKLAIAKVTSILMLLVSTGVLLPSQYALDLYSKYFGRHNRNARVLYLLFQDHADACEVKSSERRRYFSFFGYASKAHDFEGFVEFAKFAIRANCGFHFLIATRSDVSRLIAHDGEFREYRELGLIQLHQGNVLSIEEMDRYFRESFCAWNVYRCCTQSGVLSRAFMNGTPVLASRSASFLEFVQPGINGEFVDSALDHSAMLESARRMRTNITTYVLGCRKSFLTLFHYRSGAGVLAEIATKPNARFSVKAEAKRMVS